ncbi:TRAP transporter substrate-binding protein DctP [Georgenia sp. SUBG003]|uniref:TRAP transporter substrate-binding protein DctP n=1 Tax=Georgenia sp. SUBG003 TaxID=1497974 RepID=UPI003AB602AB
MAHNLGDTHVTSQALTAFAEEVEEASDGRIVVRMYGNGQLGAETHVLGQLSQGVVDMTRVSAPGLANYDPGYHVGLPYVFESEEEYYEVMDSPEMAEYFRSTAEDGFVGLTYYSSGARSFYTGDTPIRTPRTCVGSSLPDQGSGAVLDHVDGGRKGRVVPRLPADLVGDRHPRARHLPRA